MKTIDKIIKYSEMLRNCWMAGASAYLITVGMYWLAALFAACLVLIHYCEYSAAKSAKRINELLREMSKEEREEIKRQHPDYFTAHPEAFED